MKYVYAAYVQSYDNHLFLHSLTTEMEIGILNLKKDRNDDSDFWPHLSI